KEKKEKKEKATADKDLAKGIGNAVVNALHQSAHEEEYQ
ncbi:MAG: hypothetical protein UX73_C0028G0001, partial [candidate division WWE3 bacterium GW2011_GWC1_47_10]